MTDSPPTLAQFKTCIRSLLRRKETAIVTLVMILFCSILTPGQYLFGLDIMGRLLVNSFLTIFFLGWSAWLLPHALWWGHHNDIPWIWIHIPYYAPLCALISVGLVIALETEPTLEAIALMFAVLMVNVSLAVSLSVLIFGRLLRTYLGITEDEIAVWWPKPKIQTSKLGAMLEPGKTGRVLSLRAENQYTRVQTSAGESLIRMPLSDAEALLPEELGLRVHRSYWVAKDFIVAAWFEKGNPKLRTQDGQVFPVSRTSYADVKSEIESRTP